MTSTIPPPIDDDRVCVLFVDDEPSILRAIKRTLMNAPLEVLTAPDGPTALTLLAERRVDVLVSDIDMPGMNGLELLALARRHHPTTLRMLLTGQSTLDRALQAINEGEVVRFFGKPFAPSVFRDSLESLAHRVTQLRRDGEDSARLARRREMTEWLETRFPGTTAVATNEAGDVLLDVAELRAAIEASPASDLAQLLQGKRAYR
jgi:two-component system probable response regulator PhcQ